MTPVHHPPSVVYVIHEFPVRTQTFVWREVEELRRRGFSVEVFALNARRSPDVWSVGAALDPWVMPFAALAALRLLASRRAWSYVLAEGAAPRQLLRQGKAVLNAAVLVALVRRTSRTRTVHLHAHFLGRTLDVATLARLVHPRGTTLSATGHAADAIDPPNPRRLALALRRADEIVSASEAVALALRTTFGRRSHVVHCGVLPGPPPPTVPPDPDRALRLLSVGRLVPKKGFDDVIRALAELRRRGTEASLTIIGSGPEEAGLRSLASTLDLQASIEWRGHLSNPAVEAVMSESDLLVLPCKVTPGDVDGIPVVLMEAMGLGLPVVSTPVGGITELICDGDNGWLVPSSQPELLAGLIGRLAASPEDLTAARLSAWLTVSQRFNLVLEVDRLCTVFGLVVPP